MRTWRLLLDAAEAYHREVLRKASGTSDAVQRVLPRLRDPQFTTPLEVTDPVLRARRSHEAVHLRELATHGKRTALEPWHADVLAADPIGA